jgi:CRP/FNR family cyclic AMP-dependent transcriptional regulator
MVSNQMLSQIDLFEGLPEKQLEAIGKISEETTRQRGELIFQEAMKAENLYVLLEGKVAIRLQISSKPQSITVSVINSSNQSFGWSGMVAPYHYTASALCESDCRLLVIDGQKLIQVLKQDPRSGFIVMERISEIISNRLRNSRMVLLKAM